MIASKQWDWSKANREKWMIPSEEGRRCAEKWTEEGAQTVLDLGCGLGRHTLLFASCGFQVTAVDLSPEAVAHTEKWCREEEMPAVCLAADMKALPFPEGCFDRIFSYKVISHADTAGVRAVINEMRRVLRPGGKIFLTLCSKAHYAFTEENFPHVDENTVLKTEGAETNVPHFFADQTLLGQLLGCFALNQVRHVDEWETVDGKNRKKSHYFIEATRKE